MALKNQVGSHNYFNRREDERTEDKLASTGRQQKRGNEKVDLFCQALFFPSLSLDSSLADKSLQEKKEKNEHADMCQVSVRL